MAHPSTLARAQLARLLSAAVLPVASLLLSTCARDVTAPVAPTTAPFAAAPGPAPPLEFAVQPPPATAGTALAPSLRVTALDAAGNLVPTFTGNVTVAFGGTSGEGSTLGGTTTVAAVNGVATFGDLTVNPTGTGYWLTASAARPAPAAGRALDV